MSLVCYLFLRHPAPVTTDVDGLSPELEIHSSPADLGFPGGSILAPETWGNNPNCGVLLLQVGLSIIPANFRMVLFFSDHVRLACFPAFKLLNRPVGFLVKRIKG